AKRNDPTRPITFASCMHLEDKALDMVDVLCFNFYYGWYTLYGDLKAASETLSKVLDELHEKYPDKPIIVTEFGADAIAGVHRDPPEMWSEEYQAELIKVYWNVVLSKKYVVGGHIWNFADFRVGQSHWRTTLNRKGIFTRTRDPKLSAKIVKELFRNTPTYL
ncbi:MAG: glycoside hydrolase family 2 TIM barrel-domain containing protein, partial [Thermoproteota archaeon]